MNDMVRTRSDELALSQGCYYDLAAAERVRTFFRKFLRHSKGQFANQPFELLDWQWHNIIAPAFGWMRPDGTRRFRRMGIAIPKKNGKSALLSGLGLYLLIGDGEPGAEVYTAAADRNQASIIYNEACAMVRKSPALLKRLRMAPSRKELYNEESSLLYRALSADAKTKDGLNIHGLLFDELHTQPNRDLWDALKYGGAMRRQPMYVWISTAGHDRHSLCFEEWEYCRKIQSGQILDIETLAYICEPDKTDDWRDEATWKKVNPSYGKTINESSFRADYERATQSLTEENSFKRYRLNIWTRTETEWVSMMKWEVCKREYDESDLQGQHCIAGLDLANVTDIAAMVLVFRNTQREYQILPYFWLPKDAIKRREFANRYRLDNWCGQYIRTTDTPTIDYHVIRRDINELATKFNIDEICIDQWNATQVATDLESDGFDVTLSRMSYYAVSPATKECEKLILDGKLIHNGNPVLTWMLGNVLIETDAAGNVKPSKRKSAEKIDGVVALILAIARYLVLVSKVSKYEKQGMSAYSRAGLETARRYRYVIDGVEGELMAYPSCVARDVCIRAEKDSLANLKWVWTDDRNATCDGHTIHVTEMVPEC